MDITEQELARRKIYQAMIDRAMQSDPQQIVSGRTVPYHPIQGLSRLAQAYLGRKGIEESEAREKVAADASNTAISEIMAKTDKPDLPAGLTESDVLPEDVANFRAPITKEERMSMIASNPNVSQRIKDAIIEQQLKKQFDVGSSGNSYYVTNSAVRNGVYGQNRFDTREGTYEFFPDNTIPISQDASNKEEIARREAQARADVEAATKPKIAAATKSAEMAAEHEQGKENNRNSVEASLASQEDKSVLLKDLINDAREMTGYSSTGVVSQATGWLGGTPSKELISTIDAIGANIGFGALQEMRDNSKTGGALGNVSDTEGKYLRSIYSSLDPTVGPEKFRKQLDYIERETIKSWERVKAAYKKDYGVDYVRGAEKGPQNVDKTEKRRLTYNRNTGKFE